MSKKKKVSSKKPAKKIVAKPVAKKSAKAAPKKAVKKPVKKSSSTSAPKSKSPSKSIKSTAKKVAPAKKQTVKKVVKARVAKPAKKVAQVPKAKKTGKETSVKSSKPVVNTKVKSAAKPVHAKVVKPAPKKPEVKKQIADPRPLAPEKVKKESPAPKAPKVETSGKESGKKAAVDGKGRDVLAITNTIPEAPKVEISASKIASISQSITNPIRRSDSYAVKVEKEPSGKFEMEFVFHASAEMLFEFVSTASGLSEWFCDDLNIRNGIYTFIWDDQLQQARLLKTIELQLVRFQWVDKTDGSYFEFRIQKDDLTNDISLIVTDFAESVADGESSKLLWNSQIEKLRHVLGSIF